MVNPIAAVPIVGDLIEGVGHVIDEVHTSDEERLDKRALLMRIRQLPQLKELEERIAFARHPSVFVAGGRPFVIWVAGFGVGFNVIGVALLNWIGAMWGGTEFIPIDKLDWTELGVLAGLAGGTSFVRHLDKLKGVARENLRS